MSWTLKANVEFGGVANGTTSAAQDCTGANLFVMGVIYVTSLGAAPSVSDSLGNTWLPLTEKKDSLVSSRIYYVSNPTVGASQTFTLSASGSFPSGGLLAFSGAASSSPFDVENGAVTQNVTSLAPGAITPSADGELIVSNILNSATSTPANSALTVSDSANQTGTGWAVLGAGTGGAAYSLPAWTWGGSSMTNVATTIAAFKAAGGATPFIPPSFPDFATRRDRMIGY